MFRYVISKIKSEQERERERERENLKRKVAKETRDSEY